MQRRFGAPLANNCAGGLGTGNGHEAITTSRKKRTRVQNFRNAAARLFYSESPLGNWIVPLWRVYSRILHSPIGLQRVQLSASSVSSVRRSSFRNSSFGSQFDRSCVRYPAADIQSKRHIFKQLAAKESLCLCDRQLLISISAL